jgi:hypothetical protein
MLGRTAASRRQRVVGNPLAATDLVLSRGIASSVKGVAHHVERPLLGSPTLVAA